VTSIGRATGLEPLGLAVDSHAEEALYQRNAGRIFGFCLSRLRRREDAEDAVQTTFLYAFRSLRRGVVPLVESAWLLGIARNVCLERWEAAGKRGRVETTVDPAVLDESTPALPEHPDELIGLDDALTHLPTQQRRAVLLRDWRGLSYDEVAGQLGVSRSCVETLIFRGRRSLAEYLRDGAAATRRKLGSLVNLGSLLSAARTVFGGGAAATKVAAIVTVVAVSGGGVAVGESAFRGGSEPARPDAPLQVQAQTGQTGSATATPHRAGSSALPTASPTASRSGTRRTTPVRPAPHPASPPGASAAAGHLPPAAESAVATPAPPPASAAAASPSAKLKASVQKAQATVKKVTTKVPLPPVLAGPVAKVGEVVDPTPVAPVVGAVEDAVAPVVAPVAPVVDPVVGTVGSVTAPVVDPVVGTVEDVVPPLPPLPHP
jgi:RNA polymerase sigma-70 factor (ECF subfamily)